MSTTEVFIGITRKGFPNAVSSTDGKYEQSGAADDDGVAVMCVEGKSVGLS